MPSDLVSLCLWFLLPEFATSFLLSAYHKLFAVRACVPAKNTYRYQVQRNNIHIFIISLYLIYSLREAVWDLSTAAHQSGNFYTRFNGLTPAATSDDLRSQYRRLSVRLHPENPQYNNDAIRIDNHWSPLAEPTENAGTFDGQGDRNVVVQHPINAKAYAEYVQRQFAQITVMYKVLNNPITRRAYDYFGYSAVAECRTPSVPDSADGNTGICQVFSDYLYHYVKMEMVPFYLVSGAFLLLISLFYNFAFGALWRYVMLFNLAVLELYLVTQQPRLVRFALTKILHGLTVHEFITLSHYLFVVIFIAIYQLGPILVSGVHSFHFPIITTANVKAESFAEACVQPTTLQQLQIQLEPVVQEMTRLVSLAHTQAITAFRSNWEPLRKDFVSDDVQGNTGFSFAYPSTSVTSTDLKQESTMQRIKKNLEWTLTEQALFNASNEYRERYNDVLQRVIGIRD